MNWTSYREMQPHNRRILVFTVVLSVCSLMIAFYIDVLNDEAGGVLPRSEYLNDDPEQGLVKWRVAVNPATAEQEAANRLRLAVSTLGWRSIH